MTQRDDKIHRMAWPIQRSPVRAVKALRGRSVSQTANAVKAVSRTPHNRVLSRGSQNDSREPRDIGLHSRVSFRTTPLKHLGYNWPGYRAVPRAANLLRGALPAGDQNQGGEPSAHQQNRSRLRSWGWKSPG